MDDSGSHPGQGQLSATSDEPVNCKFPPLISLFQAVDDRIRAAVMAERERCAKICDELGEHWSDYKDTALLNGDIDLSNAASGEPRAAAAIAAAIRTQGEK